MSALVLVEHADGEIKDATLHAVTAAEIYGEIHLLVAGSQVAEVSSAAAAISGVSKVLVAQDAACEHQLAENLAPLLAGLMADYEALVLPATTNGKNIGPRVAALLDVMQISDVVAIEDRSIFSRPIYAGNVIATIRTSDDKKVMTIRSTAFAKAGREGGAAEVVPVNVPAASDLSAFVGAEVSRSQRPDLTSAKVIVSGGRALGSAQKFGEVITPLADRLGAAIGASRAAVDAGFAANELQVGQTGKIVAPELYVAVGISGAIQHLAGMKDSKTIVAINSDLDAPIFQVADFGLVADLFQALPELTGQL